MAVIRGETGPSPRNRASLSEKTPDADKLNMPLVSVNRESGRFGRFRPLATSSPSGEDPAPMSDAPSSLHPARDGAETDSVTPRLRLAGTSAGPVSAAEAALLELRATLVRTVSANQRDADLVRTRLERACRVDPIKEVTGRDAFETNRHDTMAMLKAVDARLNALDADRASSGIIETTPAANDLLRRP